MSSVRNRILQFQQNSTNGSTNPSASSTLKSSSSVTTARIGSSNGSVPPDIVSAATSNSIGRSSRNQFTSLSNNSSNPINNGSSLFGNKSTSSSTFPYGNSQKVNHNYSNQQQNTSGSNNIFGNSYGGSGHDSKTTTKSSTTSFASLNQQESQVNSRKLSANFSESGTLASTWRNNHNNNSNGNGTSLFSSDKKSLVREPSSGGIIRTVEIPILKSENNTTSSYNPTPPAVNRANKPTSTTLAMKKASMTINLSSTTTSNSASSSSPSPTANGSMPSPTTNSNNMNGSSNRAVQSPTRPKARAPTRPSPTSSIPKLNSSGSSGLGFGNGSSINPNGSLGTVRYRDPSPGGIGRRSPASSNRTTPVTTPTGNGGVAFGSSSMGRFYQSIGWKEKFEESEKKKNHLVTLAQKATRDYEELRRRYHDLYTDHEKLVTRCEAANNQLESLRKASEATYEEYYKLKRKYEAENREKSSALDRVDEYNKENRRLKRQSALMMQQIDPSTLLANGNLFEAVAEADSPESDREIQYLRKHVKEMEAKIIELEGELERIRLSEFESQESVLIMNDSIQSSRTENLQLKDQLRKLDEENRKLARSLEDLTLEHDSLKAKQAIDEEKLFVAESELKKLLKEKNILQRQSLVFMSNDDLDNKLLEALAQIGDLQTAVEDQKNAFESQIIELKNRLSEKELEEETQQMQHSAEVRALEAEIESLKKRAEEAERKLENCAAAPPPPPPPPPPMMGGGPPPPPLPPVPTLSSCGDSLSSSLQAAMGSLKKGSRNHLDTDTPSNGMSDGQPKSIVSASPQIDDIVSQLKQGIKLRPTDRTLSRKQAEPQRQASSEGSQVVEEMRSILVNLRRTSEAVKRY